MFTRYISKLSLGHLAICAAVAILVAGCGQTPISQNQLVDPLSVMGGGISENGVSANGWSCPATANVKPPGNMYFAEYTLISEHFTVCSQSIQIQTSSTHSNQFQVSWVDTSMDQLCIIPAYKVGSAAAVVADSPQCFYTNGTITAAFKPTSNYVNYMYIVDRNYYVDFMTHVSACLSGQTGCPSHAEGFVQ